MKGTSSSYFWKAKAEIVTFGDALQNLLSFFT